MIRETWVQSQVASYQRLLKWYLIPPCLTLSTIRYVSRVKWSNPGKGVAPSPTPRCSTEKGAFWLPSITVANNNNFNRILCLHVEKKYSEYVCIYIFSLVVSLEFFFTQLYIKYSDQIQIIYTQLYSFKYSYNTFSNNHFCLIIVILLHTFIWFQPGN